VENAGVGDEERIVGVVAHDVVHVAGDHRPRVVLEDVLCGGLGDVVMRFSRPLGLGDSAHGARVSRP
jgi:hypothetical protein